MRMQKKFTLSDFSLLLIAFFLLVTAITAFREYFSLSIVFFILFLFQTVYVFRTIRLRLRFNEFIRNEKEAENEIIENIDDNERDAYRKIKGDILELSVKKELESKYSPDSKVISNLKCPKSDGSITEIDLIMIDKSGIFVFEVKNIFGKVTNNWNDSLLELKTGTKTFSIKNPIHQNTHHIEALANVTGESKYVFRNIIVFGDGLESIDYTQVPKNVSVVFFKSIHRSIAHHKSFRKNILEASKVESIYETLKSYQDDNNI